MILLAANENPRGMPPSAQAAVLAALAQAGAYPDPDGTALKAALASRLDVASNCITLGSGSCEILELVAHVCVAPGQSVVQSQYGFIVYGQVTEHAHARGIVVPARDFGHDLGAMRAAIEADTRLVFVANPNNPTGTFIDGPRLRAFIESVPAHVTVLLDEAYTEYLEPAQRYDSTAWLRSFPNLVIARTFSKAYGLAGLRIGYGLASPEITARMNARRPRFNVTAPALAAAQAALADAAWLAETYRINAEGRASLTQALTAMGLTVAPSSGNFVMVRMPDAKATHARLLAQGIAVSPLANYGLPDWLRISIGLPKQHAALLAALRG
jgi:histidinol-phosphate aminotransferase